MTDIRLLNYSQEASKYSKIKSMMNEVDPLDLTNDTEVVFTSSNSEITNYSKTSRESLTAINNLYEEYNEKYGLELKFDGGSITEKFGNITEPKNLRVFEIYLSEVYGRVRLLFYEKLIVGIYSLLDEIMNPSNTQEVTVQDKFVMVEKALEYMSTINRVYEEIRIKNADVELKRISSEISSGDIQDLKANDPEVRRAMDELRNTTLKQANEFYEKED